MYYYDKGDNMTFEDLALELQGLHDNFKNNKMTRWLLMLAYFRGEME